MLAAHIQRGREGDVLGEGGGEMERKEGEREREQEVQDIVHIHMYRQDVR
jgi:hypothetical protein